MMDSPKTVFGMTDLAVLTGANQEELKNTLYYYKRKGVIRSPRRGLYVLGDYDEREMSVNIFRPAYLSLSYVLFNSGVVYQYTSELTCVSYMTREVRVDGRMYSFRRIDPTLWGCYDGIDTSDGKTAIASPERALTDSLYLFPQNMQFDNLAKIDWNKALFLAGKYNDRKLEQRLKALRNGAE